MERFGRTARWRWAAGISVVVALMGLVGYDVPSLIDGADASRDPYWLVLGSFASDVVALLAAYGTWQRQRWGVVMLIVANVYWMVQAVGTLFDPSDGADVAFAIVMGIVHVFTLWCVLRHRAAAGRARRAGGLVAGMMAPRRRRGPAHDAASRLGTVLDALLVAAYVFVVGGLCTLVLTHLADGEPTRPARWTVGVAAAVVAGSVPWVHRWVRAGVAGVLAATAAGPSPSLAALGEREGDEPLAHLQAMASTVRTVLDAAAVEITVHPSSTGGGWSGSRAVVGRPTGAWVDVPLVHVGRDHGVLRVSSRGSRAARADGDRLLHELARHVGLVVSSAVLRDELEASREQLVLAREEERRRIRRDLHDGLGPSLAAIKLQIGATRRQLEAGGHDPSPLDRLRAMVGDATDEVRRVIEDLRPPLLDDCGLVEALRNLGFVPPDLALRVDAPSPLPPMPAAVEVAVYRIASEAVRNAARHAGASWCTVALAFDAEHVTLTVDDDGCGVPNPRPGGVGTAAMRERAEELGGALSIGPGGTGGTSITAVLPRRGGAPS